MLLYYIIIIVRPRNVFFKSRLEYYKDTTRKKMLNLLLGAGSNVHLHPSHASTFHVMPVKPKRQFFTRHSKCRAGPGGPQPMSTPITLLLRALLLLLSKCVPQSRQLTSTPAASAVSIFGFVLVGWCRTHALPQLRTPLRTLRICRTVRTTGILPVALTHQTLQAHHRTARRFERIPAFQATSHR